MTTSGPVPVGLISVVVPAHNEAATLGATLGSLAGQRYDGAYEVVVVDNASSDDTAAIAARYGVRLVREDRLGVCRARQRGVEAARGEIVVSTDADTVHPADWLQRIAGGFAAATPDTVAIAGPCRYLDPPWWAALGPRLGFRAVGAIAARTGRVVYLTATNVAFRRADFPGYDVEMQLGGDEVDLLRRLRRRGRVRWDAANVVLTSSRRLEEGLFRTVLVSYGWHYAGQRLLRQALPGHVIPPAPTVRAADAGRSRTRRARWSAAATLLVSAVLAYRTVQTRRDRSASSSAGPGRGRTGRWPWRASSW